MPQALSCDLLLYADDSCLIFQHKDVKEIEKVLNQNFSDLCDWFVDNKLSIHFGEDKTKCVLLASKNKVKKAEPLDIIYKGIKMIPFLHSPLTTQYSNLQTMSTYHPPISRSISLNLKSINLLVRMVFILAYLMKLNKKHLYIFQSSSAKSSRLVFYLRSGRTLISHFCLKKETVIRPVTIALLV